MPATWSPIRYRDFWDFPRIFITDYRGKWFLFDCAFDEELEDYPNSYKVSLITPPSEEMLEGSWECLPQLSVQVLGDIPIANVEFDSTKRQAISSTILDELTTAVAVR